MNSFLRSFSCAWIGLCLVVREQRNFRIHLAGLASAVALATWLELDALRWAVLVVSCSIVLVAEALNTGLEYACDAITTERHPMIGKAKDVAAGAVLLAAIFAVIVGAILFIPLIRVKFGL